MPTKPPHILGINVHNIPPGYYGWLQISGHIASDDPAFQILLRQFEEVWLNPELALRRESGQNLDKIIQALIVMPKNGVSKVFFNNEAPIQVKCSFKRQDIKPKEGDPILWGDIKHVNKAIIPHVGKGDGFILIYWDGFKYHIWFDCPNYDESNERHSGIIEGVSAQYFIYDVVKMWLTVDKQVEKQLAEAGWWPALALLPQPWMDLVKAYSEGNQQKGMQCVIEFMDKVEIEKLRKNWDTNPLFKARHQPLDEIISNYKLGNWYSSSLTSVAQINGIMREFTKEQDHRKPKEWRLAELTASKMPFGDESILALEASTRFLKQIGTEFFKNIDSNETPDEVLRRHTMMHGDLINACQTLALQGILALDSLFHTIQPIDSDGLRQPLV